MKRERLSKSELADRFNVDVRTITNWVAEGMPQRVRSGRPEFDWAECYAWREQKIREDGRATRESGGDESRKEQMAEAKLRVALAEAEEAELTLAERRSQLVTIDYMANELDHIAQALRSRLLAIPPTWAARLGTCLTAVERQITLQELVNELLPVLGQAADDDDESDAASGVA